MSEQNANINSNNPFPGLRAFKGSESHLFFGREENVSDVLSKLDNSHFVAVVGTSGTGKSSLIKAGVLPAILAEGGDSDDHQWKIVSINPGSSPLENLAEAISKNESLIQKSESESFGKNLLDLMNDNSLGLVQSMRPILESKDRLLILIDQFEEVFRFASEESEEHRGQYDKFVKLIIDTVRQRDVPIYAILTLRSDFLGDCVAFEGLPEAINDGHYLVPRMTKVQLKRAITGPIDFAQGKISPRLIQHITDDLAPSSDQLPILQHAMMRCWNYWKKHEQAGDPMDVKHFASIGDLDNALSNHANEAFDELNSKEQAVIAKVFKCLTTKKADNRGVRRPMSLDNLIKITESSKEDILASMAPFQKHSRSFILPGTEKDPSLSTIYDISHESLMRGWHRLKGWVDEEMESAEFYTRICTAALLHKEGASALWRNPELQFAIDWKQKQSPISTWGHLYDENFELGLDFVAQSKNAEIIETNSKRKRTNAIRLSLIAFFVVISILAAWALLQTNIANEKTSEAQEKSLVAIAQTKLAEGAKDEAQTASIKAEESRLLAEQEAINAHTQETIAKEQEVIAKIQGEIAILEKGKALDAADFALRKQKLADLKSKEANAQKKLAIASSYEAKRLRLLALSQNLANSSAQVSQNPELASLLAIQSYKFLLANSGNTNAANLYASSSKALYQIDPNYTHVAMRHSNEVVAMSLANKQINIVDKAGQSMAYSQADFKLINTTNTKGELNTAYVNPYSSQFALGLNSNALAIHANGNSQSKKVLVGHTGLIRAVQFRKAEPSIISGGRDSLVILWSSNNQSEKIKFKARIKSISALSNASSCFIGCENGSSYKLNLSSKKQSVFASRSAVRVEKIAQSENGKFIAIAYSDGITQVYTNAGKLLKSLPGLGSPVEIKVDAKNDVLMVASSAKLIRLYTLSNLNKLPIEIRMKRQIKGVELNSISKQIYVFSADRNTYVYPMKPKVFIGLLQKKVSRKLTREEWKTFIGDDVAYLSDKPKQISTN